MNGLKRFLLVVLAFLFLIEAWLWDLFCALGLRVAACIPYERIKAAIAGFIGKLPPPAIVPIFILPALVILPFKLLGLWLIGRHHHFILGGLVFLAAKMAGLAVTAFLYDLTREKLMMMAWFRVVAAKALALKHWAHDLTEPYKAAVRAQIAAVKAALPQTRNGLGAMALRIRRQIQRTRS